MAINKISKKINLRLNPKLSEAQKTRAKKEAGDLLVDEILRSVSSGQSPVAGHKFDELDEDYADNEKGGNRTPNLELDGDMLDSLTYKLTPAGIEIGIFNSSEVPKADGHNNFSGRSKLPTRRFIPKGAEKFDEPIARRVTEITKEFNSKVKKTPKADPDPFTSLFTTQESEDGVSIQTGELFSDSFLEGLLKEAGLI